MSISTDILVTIVTVFINLIVGIFVILQNPRKFINWVFFGFLLALISWKISLSFYLIEINPQNLLLWGRANFAVSIFIGFFAVIFTNLFPNNIDYIKRKMIKVLYTIFTIILVIITLFTPLVGENELITTEGKQTIFGPLYPIFLIYLISSILLSSVILIKKYSISKSIEKKQLLIINWGFISAAIFILFTNIVMPFFFQEFSLQSLGPIGAILITLSVFISIVKYGFLDTRILIGRLTYFLILAVILIISYRIALGFDAIFWQSPYNIESIATSLPFALLVVLFYDYIKKFIQEKIDSTLINPDFDPREMVSEFNNQVSTLLAYDDIVDHTLDLIGKTVRPRYKGIIVKVDNELELTDDSKDDKVINFDFDQLIKIWKETNNYPILTDELEYDFPKEFIPFRNEIMNIKKIMDNNELKILLPISSPSSLIGIMLIGQKDANYPYNSVIIKYLESISNLTALALARSFLYDEVREFNETLQKKVELATIELEKQNSKLQETLVNERDMLDILGHELRTPLGIIRNAIGLFDINFKMGKIDQEVIQKFIKISQDNIRREIQLLETILASAKIDNAKLDLNLEKADPKKIINDSLETYKYEADKKSLKLNVELPEGELSVFIDKLRIQQVIDNLFSNAVKYTKEGTITIGLQDEDRFVRFFIRDTGVGIPKKDISFLGQKFFRVNNYLESNGKIGNRKIIRPGGNGIGLYVVFQLVKYMGGSVKVESEIGKGSTFSFTVQKYSSELERDQLLIKSEFKKTILNTNLEKGKK